mmetsp:Transcript_14502/g.42285  ORF Transcript_14502/g.42285 Transcript_14502/m.42285 type:complete len:86 (-) Transcript_14502:203-460(-)|eukprot:364009-Chlamydomonas_euryale.AAC.8
MEGAADVAPAAGLSASMSQASHTAASTLTVGTALTCRHGEHGSHAHAAGCFTQVRRSAEAYGSMDVAHVRLSMACRHVLPGQRCA